MYEKQPQFFTKKGITMPKGLFADDVPLPEEMFIVAVHKPGEPMLYLMLNELFGTQSRTQAGSWPKAIAEAFRDKIIQGLMSEQVSGMAEVYPVVAQKPGMVGFELIESQPT